MVLTLGFVLWCRAPPPHSEGFEIVLGAIKEHGDPSVKLPEGPPFFHYADAANAAEAMSNVGFTDCDTIEVEQTLSINDPSDLWRMLLDGTARTRAALLAQPAANRDAIQAAITDRIGSDVTELSMPCRISVGRKPQ